jgi:hypothetical protein
MNELWRTNDGRSVRRQRNKALSKSVSVRLTRVEYERIQDMMHAGLFRSAADWKEYSKAQKLTLTSLSRNGSPSRG